jgi:hypothetical protein
MKESGSKMWEMGDQGQIDMSFETNRQEGKFFFFFFFPPFLSLNFSCLDVIQKSTMIQH